MLRVLECGPLFGEDSLQYLRHGFQVVSVEANPDLIDALTRISAPYGSSWIVIHAAVSSDGFVGATRILNRNKLRPELSSCDREWDDKIEVPVVRLNELIRSFGPFTHVKMDIENLEFNIIQQAEAFPFRHAVIEMSNPEIPNALSHHGFNEFRLSNQNDRGKWGGRWQNNDGSGPWEEELDEIGIPWVSLQEVNEQFAKLDKASLWCDVHARK